MDYVRGLIRHVIGPDLSKTDMKKIMETTNVLTRLPHLLAWHKPNRAFISSVRTHYSVPVGNYPGVMASYPSRSIPTT